MFGKTIEAEAQPTFCNYDFNGRIAYVHEWANGHISLSTDRNDMLVSPANLDPFRSQEVVREQTGTRQEIVNSQVYEQVPIPGTGPGTGRPLAFKSVGTGTFEPVIREVPIITDRWVDTTPDPTVIGRPVQVGDAVKVLAGNQELGTGTLLEIADHYVRVGGGTDRVYYFSARNIAVVRN